MKKKKSHTSDNSHQIPGSLFGLVFPCNENCFHAHIHEVKNSETFLIDDKLLLNLMQLSSRQSSAFRYSISPCNLNGKQDSVKESEWKNIQNTSLLPVKSYYQQSGANKYFCFIILYCLLQALTHKLLNIQCFCLYNCQPSH